MGNVLEFFVKMKDMMSSGLVKIAATADKSFGKVQSMVDKTLNKTRGLGNEYDRLTTKINNAANATAKLKGGGSMIGDFVKGGLITGLIEKGLGAASELISGSYNKALQNRSLSNAINTTTGGRGNEAMAQTKSISDKYGINYEASLEGVKTLTGGLMSMNMPLKEQMKIFEGVSTGVAAMGLTADQSKGAMLALGQMASKGTVSAEELRGQLGERIPGAFGLAAKAMNVSEAQLNKMLQTGDIAAKDFLPRLAAQMQKTFGADALKNATGPQAIANRFDNALYEMQVTIGQGLMPIITPMLQMFTNLANAVLPYINEGLNQVMGFLSGINIGGEQWSFWIEWIKVMIGTIWNGVSYVAGIIWGIVKSVFQWASTSEILKDAFRIIADVASITWDIIKKVADILGWLFNNIIMPVINAIEAAYKWVKDVLGLSGNEIRVVGEVKGGGSTAWQPSGWQSNGMFGGKSYGLPGQMGKESASPSQISAVENMISPNKGSVNAGGGGNGSGGGQRNVTINLKELATIHIHASSGDSGIKELGNKIQEELLRILNSGIAIG